MNNTDHNAEFEALMAYLDGELSFAEAARVERHLASCEACQTMAAELREGSAKLAAWDVGVAPTIDPPAGLGTARGRRIPVFSSPAVFAAAAALFVVVAASIVVLQRQDAAGRAVASGPEGMMAAAAVDAASPLEATATAPSRPAISPRAIVMGESVQPPLPEGPLLIRTARISLIPRDFDAARQEIARIVSSAGGFTGRMTVSGSRGVRALTATVRIPAARLDGTLEEIKALGTVTDEGQDADDVTQQSVDLDARLSNARASERRLKEILDRRTGDLSDVLAVEREIARVRGDIERMEAERKSLDSRISYASVTVQLSEERKAAVDLGPQSLSTRFRNAFVDGWAAVFSGAVALGLVLTRVLPTLVVVSLAAAPFLLVYRKRRTRQLPHTSSR